MTQYDAKPGLMAGGIAIILSLVFYLMDPHFYLKFGSLISPLPMIYFMVQAALTEKKLNKGIISFKDAFRNSWVTYLIYSLMITIFAYILFNFIDPGLNEMVKETAIEAIEKMRSFMGDEAADKAIESMESGAAQNLASMALNFLISLILPGAVFAAIIALIVKKEDNPFENRDVL
jgi:hypothetical protein